MNGRRFKPTLLMVTLTLLTLALIWNCGSGPTQADLEGENDPPDTFVTQKSMSKVPLETDTTGQVINLNSFSYSIEFTGRDLDGRVDSFQVKVNDDAWSAFSIRTTNSGTFDFAMQTTINTVSVRAKDDQGAVDPTPATAEFTLSGSSANSPPATAVDSGPANGATTSRGVRLVVSGSDVDGHVVSFVFSLDGGAETPLTADTEGKALIDFSLAGGNLLPEGNHTISVRSVDNLGAEDPTPETRSFFVGTGFKPIMTQTDGPPDGGGWFTGANIPFAWSAATSHYSGVIERFEYSLDDPGTFSETQEASIALEPQPAGVHTFRVRSVDIAGNVSDALEVTFEVALFAPTEGILFIDNVSFNPSTEAYVDEPDMDQKILDGFFKNFARVSVWDVDRASGDDLRFPGAINSTTLPGPADLARFSSIVIMTDGGYAIGDISALLAAYFQAGGNLMITGYQTVDFGQVLKDAMGTPTVFNGFGSNFQSMEGFQTAGGNNSDAYASISGDDVVPVIPGAGARSWEITSNNAPRSLRVMFGNVGEGDTFGGFRIATEVEGDKGNRGLWIGVSLFYMDQSSTGIVKLGDLVLGERFGEM